ncbi:MAG: hypothetical protein J0H98_07595 [Solirubrobacterales bacterium]|nr:hypothetical protein [Solirubrobacterales bacterium]
MRRLWGFIALALTATLAFTAVSEAASVAYVDKGGVWVASLTGKQKRRVAKQPAGERRWQEVAQADNGRIIAVQRKPGQMSNLNRFTLWGPTGRSIFNGVLTAEPGWTSYIYPLSLDLTSNGRIAVYGYQTMNYNYPVSDLEEGTYVQPVDKAWATQPFTIEGQRWPTTVGNRIVASQQDVYAGVQKTAGQPPFVEEFNPWFSVADTGLTLERTDVSANKKVVAAELSSSGEGQNQAVIAMSRVGGLGGGLGSGTCLLPSKGLADHVSLSQDGKSVAWEDDRGLVAAGAPTFGGSQVCKLTRGVRVIARGGTFPSIGPAKVVVKKRRHR